MTEKNWGPLYFLESIDISQRFLIQTTLQKGQNTTYHGIHFVFFPFMIQSKYVNDKLAFILMSLCSSFTQCWCVTEKVFWAISLACHAMNHHYWKRPIILELVILKVKGSIKLNPANVILTKSLVKNYNGLKVQRFQKKITLS